MEHYAGIDVSLELSSVRVVDAQGKIVKEAKVSSEPKTLVCFFRSLDFVVKRIGLERGCCRSGYMPDYSEQDRKPFCWKRGKAALSAMTVSAHGAL